MQPGNAIVPSLSRKRLGLFVLWLALLALVACAVAWNDSRHRRIRTDFTSYSLAAARVLYAGGNPYSEGEVGRNYKYFPVNAVVLWPFLHVSVYAAQGIWFALNAGLLVLAIARHRKFLTLSSSPAWLALVLALLVAGRFMFDNLKLGQWNLAVYALASIGVLAARRRAWVGGGLVGIAAALKYLPALFILYFICKRQWRAAGGVLLGFMVCALVLPTLVLGPRRHIELLKNFAGQAQYRYGQMHQDQHIEGDSFSAQLFATLTPAIKTVDHKPWHVNLLNLRPGVARAITYSVSGAMLLVMCWFSAWLIPHREALAPSIDLLEVGVWFLLLLLISPEVRAAHMLSLFTAAYALAVLACARGAAPSIRSAARWGVGLALLMIAISSQVFRNAHYNDWISAYGGFALAVFFPWLAALYILSRPARRATA